MKRLGKILSAVFMTVLACALCFAFAACGGEGEDGKKQTTFSVDIVGSLSGWQYNFVNINQFGDDPWGMINIENWGEKKLALGSDNTCVGTGCVWSVKLEVEEGNYSLSLIAHLKGNGTVYGGEGDYTYLFQGSYEEVSGGYKLAAPTYVKVSLTEGFELLTDMYDFADYIPSGPWSVDSNTSDDDPFITGINDKSAGTSGLHSKLLPSTFDTVFGGAQFNVSGDKIVSVTNVTLPM